ncbi:MAG: uroporphyrinogen decarboxylase family protein [Planctomycetota bacterium]
MPYDDGWAAIHLAMPPRVPRTEYSAESHWPLIAAVTGIEVDEHSPPEARAEASRAFRRAWHYDFAWGTLIGRGEFGDLRTDMGHAEYAAGGVDRRDTIHCPFSDPEEVLRFDPWEAYGEKDPAELTRRFEESYRNRQAALPEEVVTTGIYVTLISGLIDIFGWDMLLLAAGLDPQRFGELANRYASWMQQYYDALGEADVPVVMVHDDIVWTAGPFLHPDWYRAYVFPNYRRYFAPLLASGKTIAFTSDGDYTAFLDDLVDCGVHGFVLEPMTDMAALAERYGDSHFFIGNADTRVLLGGSKPAIRAEVERCMATGKDKPGFFLAVGNHIPANTPVEACLYYNEVYEELSPRQ